MKRSDETCGRAGDGKFPASRVNPRLGGKSEAMAWIYEGTLRNKYFIRPRTGSWLNLLVTGDNNDMMATIYINRKMEPALVNRNMVIYMFFINIWIKSAFKMSVIQRLAFLLMIGAKALAFATYHIIVIQRLAFPLMIGAKALAFATYHIMVFT